MSSSSEVELELARMKKELTGGAAPKEIGSAEDGAQAGLGEAQSAEREETR